MPVMPTDPELTRLLEAFLPHVPFEGWSDRALAAAAAEAGITPQRLRELCPRGAVDLAAAHHRAGDAAMVAALRGADLSGLRFRDRVAFALRARIAAAGDREVVRRAAALFALPQHAAEGAALIWGTADLIWETLGDSDRDLAWYTKRATLAAIWASVVLYWLGDQSPDGSATEAFIDRRIADVMAFESLKGRVRASPFWRPFAGAFDRFASRVKAPPRRPPEDLPGYWGPRPSDGG